jgi:hypothetical protein
MRSPAEAAARRWKAEGVLRGVAIAALASAVLIAWWQSLRRDEGTAAATHVAVTGGLGATARDSLGALARAGHRVTWSGEVAAVAASAEPVREPGDKWRIAVVSPTAVSVRDSLGPLDSLDAPGGVLTTMAARAAVLVAAGSTEARVLPRDAVELGRVAVFGRAGWEPRFAMAALEEAGWEVDAHLTLGRDRDVRQGLTTLRRNRHSVAVVFDSASLRREATGLARFVREGGGVLRSAPCSVRASWRSSPRKRVRLWDTNPHTPCRCTPSARFVRTPCSSRTVKARPQSSPDALVPGASYNSAMPTPGGGGWRVKDVPSRSIAPTGRDSWVSRPQRHRCRVKRLPPRARRRALEGQPDPAASTPRHSPRSRTRSVRPPRRHQPAQAAVRCSRSGLDH